MKKLLLLAALAATMSPAFAEGFSDSFKVTYEGETLTNGQTVIVDYYWDEIIKEYPEYAGMFPPDLKCAAEIFVNNITDEPKELMFSLNPVSPEVIDGDLGNYQLCFYFASGTGNCLPDSSVKDFYTLADPVSAEEYVRLDVDQVKFTDLSPITLQLNMKDPEVADSEFSININFTHKTDISLAVDGIQADTKSEYFTIQGVRVAEPIKGQLYLERKGGKVVKRIF